MCDSDLLEQINNQGSCSSERDPCFFPYSSKKCSVDHPGWAEYFGYMRTGKQSLNTKTKCLEASGKPPGQVVYRKPDCCVPSKNGWAGRFLVGPEDQCASGWGRAEDGGCSDEFPGYRKWKMKFIPPFGSGWSKDDTAKVALHLPGFLPGQVTPSVPYFFDGTYGYWKGDESWDCQSIGDVKWTNLKTWDYPADPNPFGVKGPITPEGKVRYVAQLEHFFLDDSKAQAIVSGKLKVPQMVIGNQTWSKPDGYFKTVFLGFEFEFLYDDGGKSAKPKLALFGQCGSKAVKDFWTTWVTNQPPDVIPFLPATPCTGPAVLPCGVGLTWVFVVQSKGDLSADYWQRHPPDFPPGALQPNVAFQIGWDKDFPWVGYVSQKVPDSYFTKSIYFGDIDSGLRLSALTSHQFSYCGKQSCQGGSDGVYVAEVFGFVWDWDLCGSDNARTVLERIKSSLSIPDPNGKTAVVQWYDIQNKLSGYHIYAYFSGICPTEVKCSGTIPPDCSKWVGKCCTQETGCPSLCGWNPNDPVCKKDSPFDLRNLIWIGVFAGIGVISYRVYRRQTQKTAAK